MSNRTEIVQTRCGKLTGIYNEDGTVRKYLGIPYAKPPVNELRWKAPEPIEAWDDVRAMDHFGHVSMQGIPGKKAKR